MKITAVTRRVTVAAVAVALLSSVAAPAYASTTRGHSAPTNVARAWCSDVTVKVTCIEDADDDEGRFAVRRANGTVKEFTSTAQIARYLRHHAVPCAYEDSTKCFWDASERGNHRGDDFITVGDKRGPKGTPQHAVRGVTLPLYLFG